MKTTYSITEGQAKFPALVRETAETGVVTAITRRDEVVAYIVPKERMESLLETMEVLADPEAMKVIRSYEAGTLKMRPWRLGETKPARKKRKTKSKSQPRSK